MTLNIGNPSLQRVRKQIDWIEHRDEDIFVLSTDLPNSTNNNEEDLENETVE